MLVRERTGTTVAFRTASPKQDFGFNMQVLTGRPEARDFFAGLSMTPLARTATFFGRGRQDQLLRVAAQLTGDTSSTRGLARDELEQLLAQILSLDAASRTILLRVVAIASRDISRS